MLGSWRSDLSTLSWICIRHRVPGVARLPLLHWHSRSLWDLCQWRTWQPFQMNGHIFILIIIFPHHSWVRPVSFHSSSGARVRLRQLYCRYCSSTLLYSSSCLTLKAIHTLCKYCQHIRVFISFILCFYPWRSRTELAAAFTPTLLYATCTFAPCLYTVGSIFYAHLIVSLVLMYNCSMLLELLPGDKQCSFNWLNKELHTLSLI